MSTYGEHITRLCKIRDKLNGDDKAAVTWAIEQIRERTPVWINAEAWLPDPPRVVDDQPEYVVMIRGAREATVLHYVGNGDWYMDGEYYPVSHWMPLHDPPEVET